MLFERISPPSKLADLIECFWVIEDDSKEVHQQKIIPDGFPEIIFHYGDPYRVNISGEWEEQSSQLLAGQIKNHFYLENTGASGMIGIKFKPYALAELFDLNMQNFTDSVVDLNSILEEEFASVYKNILSNDGYKSKIELLNTLLEELATNSIPIEKVRSAIAMIFKNNGFLSISEIAEKTQISERHLERIFKKAIGLSPKFYCRVIRFSYIFEFVQQEDASWSEIAQLSGFYDQSHFIKNFQEFTGEDPSNYFFEELNMANFFLNKEGVS
jgi:AraC-like DNA-binding protein